MKTIAGLYLIGLLWFLAGVAVTTSLFYDGYKTFPIAVWSWSLSNDHYNCLYIRTSIYKNSASYYELGCIQNSWKGNK